MFVKAATISQLHEKRGKLVTINEVDIALFLRDGKIFALNNVCAHQHFSLLHQGAIEGLTVTCPMHGWTYDLTTGKSTTGQGRVPCYNVKVVGDDVLVEITDPG